MKLELIELAKIPDGLLTCKASDLSKIVKQPTLIHLEGAIKRPLFITIMLHGNETTGLYAIQELLKSYSDKPFPRSLSIFIGNPAATSQNKRFLKNQLDFNRIWAGGDHPEHQLADHVMSIMKTKNIFASIDIHNNTGKNPLYACINKVTPQNMMLSRLFGKSAIFFSEPKEALSVAFSKFCPSVVIECGCDSESINIFHVKRYLEQVLSLQQFDSVFKKEPIDIYITISKIMVPQSLSIGFSKKNNTDYDICLLNTIDAYNFNYLEPGTLLGWINHPNLSLYSINYDQHIDHQFLDTHHNEIRVKTPFIPSMFTTEADIIHQDCLGYIMKKLDIKKKLS